MKKFIVFAALFIFCVQASSVPAQACASMQTPTSAKEDSKPCHEGMEQQTQKQQNEHCKTGCLCLHATPVSSFIAPDFSLMAAPIILTQALKGEHEDVPHSATSPPYRPPIA